MHGAFYRQPATPSIFFLNFRSHVQLLANAEFLRRALIGGRWQKVGVAVFCLNTFVKLPITVKVHVPGAKSEPQPIKI